MHTVASASWLRLRVIAGQAHILGPLLLKGLVALQAVPGMDVLRQTRFQYLLGVLSGPQQLPVFGSQNIAATAMVSYTSSIPEDAYQPKLGVLKRYPIHPPFLALFADVRQVPRAF